MPALKRTGPILPSLLQNLRTITSAQTPSVHHPTPVPSPLWSPSEVVSPTQRETAVGCLFPTPACRFCNLKSRVTRRLPFWPWSVVVLFSFLLLSVRIL